MGLMLHAGAVPVELSDIYATETPAATETHTPIAHGFIIDTVLGEMEANNIELVNSAHGLTKDGNRYFGLLECSHPDLANGDMSTLLGLRNSHDKAFLAELATGGRVFVCDNQAFWGEHVLGRKHTGEAEIYLRALIKVAIEQLFTGSQSYAATMKDFRETPIHVELADNLIIQAARKKILGKSLIYEAAEVYRESGPVYGDESMWRLYNSLTQVMKPKSQSAMEQLPKRTIGLLKFLEANTTHIQESIIPGEYEEIA